MKRQFNEDSKLVLNKFITTIFIIVILMMMTTSLEATKQSPGVDPIFEPTIDTTPKEIHPNVPIIYDYKDWSFNIQFSTLPDSIVGGKLQMSHAEVPITPTVPTFPKPLTRLFLFTLDLTPATLVYPPNTSDEEKAILRETKTGMEVVFTSTIPAGFMVDPYSYRVLRYDEATNAFSEPVDALKIDLDYSFSINQAFGKKIIFGVYRFYSQIDAEFGKKIAVYFPTYLRIKYDEEITMGYMFPKANYFTPSNPSMVSVNAVNQKYAKLGTSRVLLARVSVTISKNPLQFEESILTAHNFKKEQVKDVVGDSYKIDLNSLTCIFLAGNQEYMAKKVLYENGVITCDVNPLLSGDHEVLIVANNANPPEPMNTNGGNVLIGLVISTIAIISLIMVAIGVFMCIKRSKSRHNLLTTSAAPGYDESTDI